TYCNELPHKTSLASAIEKLGAQQPGAAQVEQNAFVLRAFTFDEAVCTLNETDDLQIDVVLIRPEPWDGTRSGRRMSSGVAGNVRCDAHGLVLRVVPGFKAHPDAIMRVELAGNITNGVHMRRTGAAALVHGDAAG